MSETARREMRVFLARAAAERGDWAELCRLWGFKPHEAQVEVFEAMAEGNASRFVLDFGRQTGKTLFAGLKTAEVLLRPNTRVWVVAPDYDQTEEVWRYLVGALLNEGPIDPTMPDTWGLGIEPKSHKRSKPRRLELPWGSVAEAKSTKPGSKDKLAGATLDMMVGDEWAYCPESAWFRIAPALAVKEAPALFISTPNGMNHFYELWCRGLDSDYSHGGLWPFSKPPNAPTKQPEWKSFYATSQANFANAPGLRTLFDEAQRTTTEEQWRQEYLGSFETFVGQVYKEFDPDKHISEKAEYDEDYPLVLAFDFGSTNPWVCLWVQYTQGDKLHIVDEYYERDDVTSIECGRRVMDRTRRNYPHKHIEWAAADPSGKDDILTLKQEVGIRCHFRKASRARREVNWGISQIRLLLREGRLLVHPRCKETIAEFLAYRYPEKREEQNAKEEPVKDNDHAMDALRYIVAVWHARNPGATRSHTQTGERIIADHEAKAVVDTGSAKINRKLDDQLAELMYGPPKRR